MEEKLNQSLPEPGLITNSRVILNIIQYILIGFRIIHILFCGVLIILGIENMDENIIMTCFVEIGVICFVFYIIKNGYKKIAILPLLGGLISYLYIHAIFSSSNGSIILTLLGYHFALMAFFQFASMAYILQSKQIEFYCHYILYNK